MAVEKGKDGKWYVLKSDGKRGKRGYSTKATAESVQARGRALARSNPPPNSSGNRGGNPMPKDPGTRTKPAGQLVGRVQMEQVLRPRASDLKTQLEGILASLEAQARGTVPPPDFDPDPTRDSDDYQMGLAIGDALGWFMQSRGMSGADWERLKPKQLGKAPSTLDKFGLGGGVVEAGLTAGGNVLAGILQGATFGLVGGDEAVLADVIPGQQGGGAVLDLFAGG